MMNGDEYAQSQQWGTLIVLALLGVGWIVVKSSEWMGWL